MIDSPQTQFETSAREYRRALAELEETRAAYAKLLEAACRVNPQLARLANEVGQLTGIIEDLKNAMTNMARDCKQTFSAAGVKVEFSDPVTKVVDAVSLMRECPAVGAIPGLITYAVDNKVLEIAMAAGRVDELVVAKHTELKRTTANGRVQFKLLGS